MLIDIRPGDTIEYSPDKNKTLKFVSVHCGTFSDLSKIGFCYDANVYLLYRDAFIAAVSANEFCMISEEDEKSKETTEKRCVIGDDGAYYINNFMYCVESIHNLGYKLTKIKYDYQAKCGTESDSILISSDTYDRLLNIRKHGYSAFWSECDKIWNQQRGD